MVVQGRSGRSSAAVYADRRCQGDACIDLTFKILFCGGTLLTVPTGILEVVGSCGPRCGGHAECPLHSACTLRCAIAGLSGLLLLAVVGGIFPVAVGASTPYELLGFTMVNFLLAGIDYHAGREQPKADMV